MVATYSYYYQLLELQEQQQQLQQPYFLTSVLYYLTYFQYFFADKCYLQFIKTRRKCCKVKTTNEYAVHGKFPKESFGKGLIEPPKAPQERACNYDGGM